MRKFVMGVLGATALASASAAGAVTFAGSTSGCLSLTSAPCAPGTTSTLAGLTFNTGSFSQNTSSTGFAAVGSGNTDTFGFFTQDGTANNYTGDKFTLRINFTSPGGVTGPDFFADLIGSVGGAGGDNGGVNVSFAPSTQIFHSSIGDFTLHINDVAVSGTTGVAAPITGYFQMTGVPEPATWAMMLLGFGGIGLTMRRRRSNPVLAQIA